MKKLILPAIGGLLLFVMMGTAKAQEPIPEFDFGDPFVIGHDYLFSAEQEVVGCSVTRTDSCIKEFRYYDVTKFDPIKGTGRFLVATLPAPPDASTAMALTHLVTTYKKMGDRKFVAVAVDSTGRESRHSNEAFAAYLPPVPVGTSVKTPPAP